jgi:hypothetical protein
MKDLNVSIFRDLYKSKNVPFISPLWKVLERVRVGKAKEQINIVRSYIDNKEKYTEEKNKLNCIVFAGVFNERSKKGLEKHSGLCVLDFDKMPDEKEYQKTFKTITKNKHVVTAFRSPGGKGIKAVIKIPPCNAIDHEKYFKEFNNEFNIPYFDPANCNVDRICFESIDPDIYINYEANTYSPVLIDTGFEVRQKVPLIPIDNEDDIIEKIMKFNWKKDFRDGERNNFIFDLAGAFCEYGISQTTAEGYILNNVVIGEFSERETITTIKSAYKLRQFNTKYFENYKKLEAIKYDLKKGKDKVIEKHKINEDVYDEIKEVAEADDFWYYDDKEKLKISPLKYKIFLEGNGFKKYYPSGGDKPTFVKVESNKVEETSTAKIKDFVLDYLADLKQFDVWNYCAGYQNLFSEQFLLMLDSIELLMLKDTLNKSFIAFENGILEVTKKSKELKEYLDVDGYIWKSHILPREWKELDEWENDYSKFVNNISNEEPLPVECCIGYLLCTYKNKSNNKAIILNDEVITENPEGGTGKGLFIQGVSMIRKTHIIDGKSHNDKASFQNQSVSLDDKILVFDDIPKNWSFENQFSLITEGITIRHLYKDPVKLSVQDSPKIVITTNYAVRGQGNSHDRRRHEIEVAQYYGKDLTPEDEFGRQLFDEWDNEQWSKFDNYMAHCLQVFLRNGLVRQNAKNLKLRKFIAETAMEFYEWAKEDGNLPINDRLEKTTYYENFKREYQDFNKWLTAKRFNIWIQKYCSFTGQEYKDGNSNGMRWFEIVNENYVKPEDEIEF